MVRNVLEAPRVDVRLGLSSGEVADRVDRGLVNRVPHGPSRTVGDILRANILTRFNLILTVLLVVILVVAPFQDALFGIVLVVNAGIGIVQELRAKQTLDRLRLIEAPRARVLRDGHVREVPVDQVVIDDVLDLRAGDQVVADGVVVGAEGLEVDEALLSGESEPVGKAAGDVCRSGSVVVAGAGRMVAVKVGANAYATRLATEARRFTQVDSELKRSIDVILAVVGWSLIPIGVILVLSQVDLEGGLTEAARGAVAGMVAMIPQGLVLLTSIAFAVAVVRLARRRTLVQELPSVEILARVDTLCIDKTGTITEGLLRLLDVEAVTGSAEDARRVLGSMASADPSPNATTRAIAAACPGPDRPVTEVRPFSSQRRWSGAIIDGQAWILGAPDDLARNDRGLQKRVRARTVLGHRVLLLAMASDLVAPDRFAPVALVVLGDSIRPDAAETLRFFRRQGVDVKVISGDHPATVQAIVAQAGIRDGAGAIDGRDLPTDLEELRALVARHRVFGRISPHQKQAIVRALRTQGRTVAMTGDGVNDVLALKDADIGIAMGSGSGASRAVSQLVLLDSTFATLPQVVGEGRRIIANIERVANLFLTKTVYAVLLALAAAAAQLEFPFLPRHLTLVGSLTIGIPGFFLALEPTGSRAERGLLRRAWRFSVPTGALAAAASFAAYGLARLEDAALETSRATATIVLFAVGLYALAVVSRPLTTARQTLLMAMAGLFVIVLMAPSLRDFYALPMPRPVVLLAGIGIAAITGVVIYGALRAIGWLRIGRDLLSRDLRPDAHRIRRRLLNRLRPVDLAPEPDRPPAQSSGPAPRRAADPATPTEAGESPATQLRLPVHPEGS